MNQLFSIAFIVPVILFIAPIGVVLRSEIVYWSMLVASLLFPWIAYEIVENNLGTYDVKWFVSTVTLPALFLLYKLFDRCILKLKGRHLFLAWKGYHLPTNESWLDLIFQIFLMMSPLVWFEIGKWIFD